MSDFRYKLKVIKELAPFGVEEDLVDLADIISHDGLGTLSDSGDLSAGDVDIGGTLDVAGDSTLATVAAGAATVTNLTDSGLSASQAVVTDANKKLVSLSGVNTAFTSVTAISAITIVKGIITAITVDGE